MSTVTRRAFLKSTAIGSGSLVVGLSLNPVAMATVGNTRGLKASLLLTITPDNRVIFTCPRDEMGQGVTTGLATLVAEELDVDPAGMDIRLPGAHEAFANPGMGIQITGGSTSVKEHYQPLRQLGANTRELLLQAAARDLGVARDSLSTDSGYIIRGEERYPYGEFVSSASGMQLPEETPLKPASEFRYIGKEMPRLDGMAKSTGTAEFGIDVDIPGMHHAVVVRPPVAGGEVVSFDPGPVLDMPGVTEVIPISSGIAVVAAQFWQAKKAAAALQPEWKLPALANVSSDTLRRDYEQALAEGDGLSSEERGDLDAGFAATTTVLEQTFWTPFLSHAPLEPMNAVAQVKNGEADIWAGNQTPQAVQGLVARALDIDRDKVRVHSTYMGGGFGRRGTVDYTVEAAEIAAASGRPVKLIWTREDDMQHGLYRPASLMRIRAGVDADGHISAWHATRVGGNLMPTTLATTLPGIAPAFVPEALLNLAVKAADKAFTDWTTDSGSVEGLADDYDFPNREVLHITRDHGLPLTYWRSVGHSFTAFAKEIMVDELAQQANIDPVTFRLRNLEDNPRLAAVLQQLSGHIDSMEIPTGRAIGIAAHFSFNTYVAQAAEVSVENGKIRVHRVVCAVDCGVVVNPDVVRAQMEGAVMFGLTAALHGKVELENGRVRQSNFHDYPILRMDEAPAVEVLIVDSDAPPTGVGEPGLPPIAPAVANAVYAATGKRLHSLPLDLSTAQA